LLASPLTPTLPAAAAGPTCAQAAVLNPGNWDVETLFGGAFGQSAWYVESSSFNHRVVVNRLTGPILSVEVLQSTCDGSRICSGPSDAVPFVCVLPLGTYYLHIRHPGGPQATFAVSTSPTT
jgi:hypothetical protein